MRILLAANAKSGTQTDPEEVAAALRGHGADVSVVGIEQLQTTSADGVDRVVVAGGDGSVGLAAEVAGAAAIPLAVIPTGTANDFARSLDLPPELDDAAALAADPEARTRPLDLAHTGDRSFVNAASAGLATEAARQAAPMKPLLGPLAYALGALRAG